MRIVEGMLRRVPTTNGQIEPARKGDRIVGDDDFLVLRTPKRRLVIETELDLVRRRPVERQLRKQLALERIEHRIIPEQQPDRELGATLDQRGQKFRERDGIAIVGLPALADQPGAAVDVPADNQDRMAR